MKLKLESLFLNSSRPPTSVKLNLITACYPESHLMYSNGGSKMLMKCCLNVNDDFSYINVPLFNVSKHEFRL